MMKLLLGERNREKTNIEKQSKVPKEQTNCSKPKSFTTKVTLSKQPAPIKKDATRPSELKS